MGENEFEIEGVIYKAIEVDLSNGCDGCAMRCDGAPFKCMGNSYEIPDCDPSYRGDEKNVIFVEKPHD